MPVARTHERNIGAIVQDVGEAGSVVALEDRMQVRKAQIGIHQEHLLAGAGERVGQQRGDGGLALSRGGAGDEDRARRPCFGRGMNVEADLVERLDNVRILQDVQRENLVSEIEPPEMRHDTQHGRAEAPLDVGGL